MSGGPRARLLRRFRWEDEDDDAAPQVSAVNETRRGLEWRLLSGAHLAVSCSARMEPAKGESSRERWAERSEFGPGIQGEFFFFSFIISFFLFSFPFNLNSNLFQI